MIDRDRALGALLGTAIGDALGMPIEGLSHQNVRTYYRGIKEFRADEKRRDLKAGQWTHRTQVALAVGSALSGARAGAGAAAAREVGQLRRLGEGAVPPAGSAPAAVAAVAVCAVAEGWTPERTLETVHDLLDAYWPRPESLVAAFGQAHALKALFGQSPEAIAGKAFIDEIADATAWAEARLGAANGCSERLTELSSQLDSFPLDLQDCCNGTGFAPDEAWPFAVAMFARNPLLVEGTLLSAVNVGGDAPTVGACTGALLGALNGAAAFPATWTAGVEGRALFEDLVADLGKG
jgi:ADP-ribosyl-[dinitrogen reductase] hydrolase